MKEESLFNNLWIYLYSTSFESDKFDKAKTICKVFEE